MNRVGYETAGPKRFVVRSEENLGPSGHFEIVDVTDRRLFEGTASRVGPAGGAGPFHYVGRFPQFRDPGGDFRVRFEAGNSLGESVRFGVGTAILWRLTKPLAVHYLRSSRATRDNYRGAGDWTPPGLLGDDDHFHDVGRGWFDSSAGGFSLDLGARVILGLLLAAARDPRDPQVREELRWGADWFKRLMTGYPSSGELVARAERDGRLSRLGPGSCVEPPWGLLAGLLYARLSEATADVDLLRRGNLFWDAYRADLAGLESEEASSAMLMSEVALHVAQLEPRYLASAERRAEALMAEAGGPESDGKASASWERPGVSLPAAALIQFAESLPDHPITPRAKELVGRFLDAKVERAQADPFGLVPHPAGQPTGELAMRRAEEAWQALAAYRVTGRPAYVELATNALNWILGLNTEGECLLRGAGVEGNEEAEGGAGIVSAPGAGSASAHVGTAAAYLTALSLL